MCELGVLGHFCSSVQLSLTVLIFGVHGKNIFPIFIDRHNSTLGWNCEVSYFSYTAVISEKNIVICNIFPVNYV